MMCDGKSEAQQMVRLNKGSKVRHFWDSMMSMEASFPCCMHPGHMACSSVVPPLETDILVCCSPCQPFSGMRSSSVCTTHPLFNVTFGEQGSACSMPAHILPKVYVVEQVWAFTSVFHDLEGTPLAEFIRRVMATRRGDGSKHFSATGAFRLDSRYFVPGSRERLSYYTA